MSINLAHLPEGVPWGERSAIKHSWWLPRKQKGCIIILLCPHKKRNAYFYFSFYSQSGKTLLWRPTGEEMLFLVFCFQGHKQSLQGFLLVLSSMCHSKRLSTGPRIAASQQKAGAIVQRVSLRWKGETKGDTLWFYHSITFRWFL